MSPLMIWKSHQLLNVWQVTAEQVRTERCSSDFKFQTQLKGEALVTAKDLQKCKAMKRIVQAMYL